MKKALAVSAVAVLFGATTVFAATELEYRVVSTGDVAVVEDDGPGVVQVFLQARLTGDATDGLAIIGANLDASATGGVATPDLCDTDGFLLEAPADMDSFDRKNAVTGIGFNNTGLTNPSGSANLSGYSGTCDGAGGLLQLGGGQNTIGNTPGGAPYPIGTVVLGKGNGGGWQVIAEGQIAIPALDSDDEIVISANTVFANTINLGQGGPVYAVTEVDTYSDEGSLTIHAVQGVLCAAFDVNCDGGVSLADIAIVQNSSNFQNPNYATTGCDRANTDGVAGVGIGDIAAIASSQVWQEANPGNPNPAPCPCICVTNTPAQGGCPDINAPNFQNPCPVPNP